MLLDFSIGAAAGRSDGSKMPETKDPAIKLFGKTIPLTDNQNPAASCAKSDPVPMPESDDEKDACEETCVQDEDPMPGLPEEVGSCPDSSSGLKDVKEAGRQDSSKENKGSADPKPDEYQLEKDDDGGQEKAPKKPNKILPCPRCNSLDTKFCYYNNYNVNQPRHFCKNCQRYWTAGGTMRNVPVGAGRRKNKHSATHYRHIVMSSDGVPATRVDTSGATHHQVLSCGLPDPAQTLKGNGTVLKFGPEAPLCESMASVLNLGDQKRNVERGPVACTENKEELSSGSSVTSSTCLENDLPKSAGQMEQRGIPVSGFNGLPPTHPMHLYPVPPWAYPWSPGWNNMAAISAGRCSSELVYGPDNGNNSKPGQWSSPTMVASPAFCAPSVSFPFVPTAWGCLPGWTTGAWNVPWVGGPNGSFSPLSSTSDNGCSGNGSPLSPTLGKHSRDVNLEGIEKTEKCLWVPKTLRIDNPDEAARSSILATLGIKHDDSKTITKGGVFKAFQPKMDSKNHTLDTAQVLHANPAALSRSQTFQENT